MPSGLGAGVSPAGVGPYGVGTPALGTVPTGKPLKAADGTQYGSRKISTDLESSGQYVFDADGNIVGERDVRQLVLLALKTKLKSSVIQTLGATFSDIRTIGDDFRARMTAAVNAALANLVAASLIAVESVDVIEINGGRADTRALLTDLTTGQQFQVNL